MAEKQVGYMEVKKNADDWAVEVSAIANELLKCGFVVYSNERQMAVTRHTIETFYERQDEKNKLLDNNSWIRFVERCIVSPQKGNANCYLEFRKGIDGDIKRYNFSGRGKPRAFDVEAVTKEFGGLEVAIETSSDEFAFLFEKCNDGEKRGFAIIELIYKIEKVKGLEDAGFVTSCVLKDRTLEKFGEEVASQVAEDTILAKKLMRRYIRDNGKSIIIGNPYVDIEFGVKKLKALESQGVSSSDEEQA